jgi:hypothetical protein
MSAQRTPGSVEADHPPSETMTRVESVVSAYMAENCQLEPRAICSRSVSERGSVLVLRTYLSPARK